MNSRVLLVDVAIAAVLAILVLTLTPGLAIAGLIAIIALLACAITLAFTRRAGRPPRRRTRR